MGSFSSASVATAARLLGGVFCEGLLLGSAVLDRLPSSGSRRSSLLGSFGRSDELETTGPFPGLRPVSESEGLGFSRDCREVGGGGFGGLGLALWFWF